MKRLSVTEPSRGFIGQDAPLLLVSPRPGPAFL